MSETFTKSAKAVMKDAMGRVPAISAEKALALEGSPDDVFVDLRDSTERAKTGVVPGAVESPRGMMKFHIDPESPAHKTEFNQDRTYVFCRAPCGGSAVTALMSIKMGLSPGRNMSGGVGTLKETGGRLE